MLIFEITNRERNVLFQLTVTERAVVGVSELRCRIHVKCEQPIYQLKSNDWFSHKFSQIYRIYFCSLKWFGMSYAWYRLGFLILSVTGQRKLLDLSIKVLKFSEIILNRVKSSCIIHYTPRPNVWWLRSVPHMLQILWNLYPSNIVSNKHSSRLLTACATKFVAFGDGWLWSVMKKQTIS